MSRVGTRRERWRRSAPVVVLVGSVGVLALLGIPADGWGSGVQEDGEAAIPSALDGPVMGMPKPKAITAGSCFAVNAMADYVTEHLCDDPYATPATVPSGDTGCLEIIKFQTCKSGCWRKMYNYRAYAGLAGNLDFHMSLPYLRALHSNLETELSIGETCSNGLTFGTSMSGMLWTHVQAMMRHPQTRFHRAYTGRNWTEKTLNEVIPSKTVDPDKFAGLTLTTGRFQVGSYQNWSKGIGYSAAYYDATGHYFPTSAHAMSQSAPCCGSPKSGISSPATVMTAATI